MSAQSDLIWMNWLRKKSWPSISFASNAVAGQTSRSVAAFANLKKICEDHLAGRYNIEVVDLVKHPQLAAGDQILAIPTLVRKLPQPLRKIVGDLRDTERALVGLQLRPAGLEKWSEEVSSSSGEI